MSSKPRASGNGCAPAGDRAGLSRYDRKRSAVFLEFVEVVARVIGAGNMLNKHSVTDLQRLLIALCAPTKSFGALQAGRARPRQLCNKPRNDGCKKSNIFNSIRHESKDALSAISLSWVKLGERSNSRANMTSTCRGIGGSAPLTRAPKLYCVRKRSPSYASTVVHRKVRPTSLPEVAVTI